MKRYYVIKDKGFFVDSVFEVLQTGLAMNLECFGKSAFRNLIIYFCISNFILKNVHYQISYPSTRWPV